MLPLHFGHPFGNPTEQPWLYCPPAVDETHAPRIKRVNTEPTIASTRRRFDDTYSEVIENKADSEPSAFRIA